MGRVTALLLQAAACACMGGEQADTGAPVSRVYTLTVSPAEHESFEDGVKAYVQCLQQHGSPHAHSTWLHESGSRWIYTFVTDQRSWAGFDGGSQAGIACSPGFVTQALDHAQDLQRSFLEMLPEFSHGTGAVFGSPMLEVDSFVVADPQGFLEVMRALHAAAERSHAGDYLWLKVTDGGRGSADYLLLVPYRDWEDFGRRPEVLWHAAESVYGGHRADSLRKAQRRALRESWSDMQSRDDELSYTPPAGG